MKKWNLVKLHNSSRRKVVFTSVTILIFSSCVQTFIPPPTTAVYNYLVIDGFINAGNESTYIKLSRTEPLADTTIVNPEINANVTIEGNNNNTFPLYEIIPGTYSCGPFNANNNLQYRLHVTTSNGSQYRSDYVTPMFAPPIDSITWAKTDSGSVTVYVNTHNDVGTPRYYLWSYSETWEFHPIYESFVTMINGV